MLSLRFASVVRAPLAVNTLKISRALGLQVVGGGRNLVDSEIDEIFSLHRGAPDKWPVQQLALKFGVRKEIVMGVIRMKEVELEAKKALEERQRQYAATQQQQQQAAGAGEENAANGEKSAAKVPKPSTLAFHALVDAAKIVSRNKFIHGELAAQLAGMDPNAAAAKAAKDNRAADGILGKSKDGASKSTQKQRASYVFVDPLDDSPQDTISAATHIISGGGGSSSKAAQKKRKAATLLAGSQGSMLDMKPKWPQPTPAKPFRSRYIIVETGAEFNLQTRGILVRETDGSCREATKDERLAAHLRVGGSDPLNRFHTHDPVSPKESK